MMSLNCLKYSYNWPKDCCNEANPHAVILMLGLTSAKCSRVSEWEQFMMMQNISRWSFKQGLAHRKGPEEESVHKHRVGWSGMIRGVAKQAPNPE